MRRICAWAATSVDLPCRSRTVSSRFVFSLSAEGPPKAATTSSSAIAIPASSASIESDTAVSCLMRGGGASGRPRRGLLRLLGDQRLEAAELAEQRAAAGVFRAVLAALLEGQRQQPLERLRDLRRLRGPRERL